MYPDRIETWLCGLENACVVTVVRGLSIIIEVSRACFPRKRLCVPPPPSLPPPPPPQKQKKFIESKSISTLSKDLPKELLWQLQGNSLHTCMCQLPALRAGGGILHHPLGPPRGLISPADSSLVPLISPDNTLIVSALAHIQQEFVPPQQTIVDRVQHQTSMTVSQCRLAFSLSYYCYVYKKPTVQSLCQFQFTVVIWVEQLSQQCSCNIINARCMRRSVTVLCVCVCVFVCVRSLVISFQVQMAN